MTNPETVARKQLIEAMSAVSEDRTCCGWASDWARTLHAEGGIWETLGRAVGWPIGNYDAWVWVPWEEAAQLYGHETPAAVSVPPPAPQAAALSEAERTMLAYALDQAQEHIWSRDGFTDEDQAAVTSLRRLAADAPTTTKPETGSCVHCGKTIRRIIGTLSEWWVHDPGGHTICFPEQAASSPRATPKPAAGVRQDGATS